MKASFLLKKKIIIRGCIILLISYSTLILYVKKQSNQFCYKNIDAIPKATVGLVLGAGIKGKQPSAILRDRLDKGIQLYQQGKIEQLLISGDNGNDHDDEISVMKAYLITHAIPMNRILTDTAGYDTYSSMYRAKHRFHLDSITIVTQNYHLDRSVFIAKELGIHSYGFIADKSVYKKEYYYSVREYLAIVKAYWDIIRGRKVA